MPFVFRLFLLAVFFLQSLLFSSSILSIDSILLAFCICSDIIRFIFSSVFFDFLVVEDLFIFLYLFYFAFLFFYFFRFSVLCSSCFSCFWCCLLLSSRFCFWFCTFLCCRSCCFFLVSVFSADVVFFCYCLLVVLVFLVVVFGFSIFTSSTFSSSFTTGFLPLEVVFFTSCSALFLVVVLLFCFARTRLYPSSSFIFRLFSPQFHLPFNFPPKINLLNYIK